jgi:hypothetical protein
MTCLECSKPWGVILERGELPSNERQRSAQAELEEELRDYLDKSNDNDEVFDFTSIEQCSATLVVFISQGLADFASDRFGSYMGDCPAWYRLKDCDLPLWLLKGRKTRWAYLWDCCDMNTEAFAVKVDA